MSIAGLAWLTIAAGLAICALQIASTRLRVPDRGWRRGVASAVAVGCLVLALMVLAEYLPGSESPYLLILQGQLYAGDIQMPTDIGGVGYRAFSGHELVPPGVRRRQTGQIRPVRRAGVGAASLPGVAASRYAGPHATALVADGAARGLASRLAWLLASSARAAWLGWAFVFRSAIFFLPALTVFPESARRPWRLSRAPLQLQLELNGSH